MFEKEFEALYRKQLPEARGQRRENLEGELYGTRKMLEVVYPVIGTLDGVVLEHEMTTLSGIKIYGDALGRRTHAEKLREVSCPKDYSINVAVESAAAMNSSYQNKERDLFSDMRDMTTANRVIMQN